MILMEQEHTHIIKMAASVYATPPPDFSGEETALSDTSNSSQTNSSNNSTVKASKRSLSSAFLNSPQALNSATQLSSDSLPDLSKKRRKQPMPSRISANGADNSATANAGNPELMDEADESEMNEVESIASAFAEQQNNFQKIFLSNLSQLQKQHLLQQQVDDPTSKRDANEGLNNDTNPIISLDNQDHLLSMATAVEIKEQQSESRGTETAANRAGNSETSVDRNENEIKNLNNDDKMESITNNRGNNEDKLSGCDYNEERTNTPPELNLKKEFLQDTEWDGEIRRSSMQNIPKTDEWLSLPNLPFPFPPEAAAALSASGYLPHLPLLSMPSVSSFGSNDSSNRPNVPPLRIFNPEAYCDLCNKEFCNKYFLKTHKANKHGIYEPQSNGTDSLSSIGSFNPLHQLSQVFQLQQQQAALQEQQEKNNHSSQNQNTDMPSQHAPMRPTTSPKLSVNSIQPTVFCDICFKKFGSLSAMRKHRSKAHEAANNHHHQQQQQQQPQLQQSVEGRQSDSPSEIGRMAPSVAQFRFPEGFREDYSIEQEDASFTPQPRKLSPLSIQAAREANFSVDKLKRLGVNNPEAFCEICCKEYCNKYFLRTHKLKRHGVFLPPEEFKDERNSWNFVQTSPLNLIVGDADVLGFPPPPLKRLTDGGTEEFPKSSSSLKDEAARNVGVMNEEETPEDKLDVKEEMTAAEQEAEAISVDLQKLQSMIMQLNDLNNQRKMNCSVCGKEMENQYMLHAHMIQEHNNMNENNNGSKTPPGSASMSASPKEYEVCKQCDKEFSSAYLLKQHLMEVHGTQNGSPKREGFITPERPITAATTMSIPAGSNYVDRKPTFSMTPTSSYCEICNKELCNKYFMKTHMQRMHGIEIENGAQIGGVVCNICNKELCSKYFLRVHKHNTHGIVEEGAPLPQPRNNIESTESSEAPISGEGVLKPGEISDMSNRYYSHFTEVCPLCSRRFRSSKWLRAHLLSDHGKMGVDKLREIEHKIGNGSKSSSPSLKIPNGGMNSNPVEQKMNPRASFGMSSTDTKFMLKNPFSGLFVTDPTGANVGPKGYQCSYCSFATPLLPLLFIHERTHTSFNIVQQQLLQDEEESHAQLLPMHLAAIKTESAASLTKETSASLMQSSIPPSSETPSLIQAASTSLPPMSQDGLSSQQSSPQQQRQQERSPQLQNPSPRPTIDATVNPQEQQQQQAKPSSPPHANQNAQLSEMANLTQRPAVYALPQQSGPLLMQSFLIEESAVESRSKEAADDQPSANRFVPAVVFLPVKERIHSPMTISFTLSPA
ncbi:uncharacterized protein LOC129774116 [Toxorhynchites rutilus septentrionalis]|uniref:uncharacterized protein LOC129774116 n=1 Tax=Toxorhynchites rutilus septentrionalis TaxID=329112 RepID=UPI002478FC29|nr:uncharacterized protein LOC129774116 [Toxorhynchites rutilus septentrionalis]